MNQILILGAGKSSSHLIKFLGEQSVWLDFRLVIMDLNIDLIPDAIAHISHVKIIKVTSPDITFYESYISDSFLTISMLPAFMHLDIAKMCLAHNVHLITPSYISEEMKAMDIEVKNRDLIFLNEMGFDPGIDHMTTMKIFHELETEGAKLYSYKSYAGGLVAPKSDNNPWHYKFSWNPRNVILAGQGGHIVYKKNNASIEITYSELFAQNEKLRVSNGQEFDAYANRDSLKYQEIYGWESMETLYRGTLRYKGFCQAWNILIELGLTDNTRQMDSIKGQSYADFFQLFIKEPTNHFLAQFNYEIQEKLNYIGFMDTNSKVERNGTPAEILQSILEKKWKLNPEDTDWIVMVHLFEYEKEGKKYQIESFLSLEGESALYTAMSKTVGMPIAFAALMVLKNQINSRGVLMPILSEIYIPILNELEAIGVKFTETKTAIS